MNLHILVFGKNHGCTHFTLQLEYGPVVVLSEWTHDLNLLFGFVKVIPIYNNTVVPALKIIYHPWLCGWVSAWETEDLESISTFENNLFKETNVSSSNLRFLLNIFLQSFQ
ncbi:hypothetical protein OUZ56_009455 [Daphnia magna]|uniref:Uncharacterized protein n=1 Tax=Daphnia magna TaxID=35525 RepID=A0ABR0AG08_9CRUS|nr:hypothetical protein OUZ56_009455 [Daphnia magna]